jgi:hypothetical protein
MEKKNYLNCIANLLLYTAWNKSEQTLQIIVVADFRRGQFVVSYLLLSDNGENV